MKWILIGTFVVVPTFLAGWLSGTRHSAIDLDSLVTEQELIDAGIVSPSGWVEDDTIAIFEAEVPATEIAQKRNGYSR